MSLCDANIYDMSQCHYSPKNYDDKIEIHYNYTENNDPDGDDRDFVLYAALIQDIKKQTKPNLIVQLSLSWLHDLDVN